MALAGKAVELRRRHRVLGVFDRGELLTERGLKTVLERERRRRNYPDSRTEDSFFLPFGPHGGRRRQRRRRCSENAE